MAMVAKLTGVRQGPAGSRSNEFGWRLLLHLRAAGIKTPLREFRFARPRRWRFDFCWPEERLAVEVEGGTWTAGRHTRGAGMEADCELNAAVLLGWRVLRFTTDQVADGRALALIERFLSAEGE